MWSYSLIWSALRVWSISKLTPRSICGGQTVANPVLFTYELSGFRIVHIYEFLRLRIHVTANAAHRPYTCTARWLLSVKRGQNVANLPLFTNGVRFFIFITVMKVSRDCQNRWHKPVQQRSPIAGNQFSEVKMRLTNCTPEVSLNYFGVSLSYFGLLCATLG